MVKFFFDGMEIILGKGENSGHHHWLPFRQSFQERHFPEVCYKLRLYFSQCSGLALYSLDTHFEASITDSF